MLLRFVISALLAYATLLPFSVQAQSAYRWVDNEGRVHYSDQPPMPSEARKVERRKLDSGAVDDVSGETVRLRKAMQDFPLTLYTAPSCKEHCQYAREFLSRRNIPFSEKSLQTNEDLESFKNYTGITETVVPVLLAGGIGGKTEKGFEVNAWRKLLESCGYPTAEPSVSPPKSAPTESSPRSSGSKTSPPV